MLVQKSKALFREGHLGMKIEYPRFFDADVGGGVVCTLFPYTAWYVHRERIQTTGL